MSNGMRKSYVDATDGQIHLRSVAARGKSASGTLVCLHPAPYSGAYFETAMPLLNDGRRVVAPDYPGYGNSYPLKEPPTVRDYAVAMREAVLSAEGEQPVDLLGFHSGCLVAAELSLLAPERVGQLIMIDVPYFDRDTQASFAGKVAKPMPLSHELGCLDKAWDFNVASRKDVVPLDRAFDLFVDQVSSGVRDYYCFHAAFSYDCVGQFARIRSRTTLIATESPLRQATQAAAAALSDATLIAEPAIKTSVFEQGAEQIAGHVLRALRRE